MLFYKTIDRLIALRSVLTIMFYSVYYIMREKLTNEIACQKNLYVGSTRKLRWESSLGSWFFVKVNFLI